MTPLYEIPQMKSAKCIKILPVFYRNFFYRHAPKYYNQNKKHDKELTVLALGFLHFLHYGDVANFPECLTLPS